MRPMLTGSLVALLLVPVATAAQSPAIQVSAGSSLVVTLPRRTNPTAVLVLYRGVPASGVSAKLGQQGLEPTVEVTADRLARTGTGYTIRLTTGTAKIPDIPLEILGSGGSPASGGSPELAMLGTPPIARTFTPKRLTTAALKFTGQRPPPFEPKSLTTAALKFTGQRPPPFEPKSLTTAALKFTGQRPEPFEPKSITTPALRFTGTRP
jgi:hypothetical protein